MEKPPLPPAHAAGSSGEAPYPAPSTPATLAVHEAAAVYRCVAVYQAGPQERIAAIREGVPARRVDALARLMHVSKESLVAVLGLSRATQGRKARAGTVLAPEESERVLGIEALIGQAQAMVQEAGDPAQFDAPRWMARWMHAPLPALGGRTPASYFDTVEGQKLVSRLLAMMRGGAYA
jgi:putative toxin-antitoxin system antitoxin component (TIGR02293 family)